jgi:glyoxylate/hydroxypyruvate reductase A
MGAGVDHVLSDETIPKHIPVCRVIDPQMAFSMSNYILMALLNHHRSWYEFQAAQENKHWAQFEYVERPVKVGVLGIGHLGMDAANKIHHLGFPVLGYSNSPKKTVFPSYSGDQFEAFISQINVLVCTVPYTSKTHGMLNYQLFEKFKEPTYLINVSRGAVQVEKDIVKALNKGLLSGAFLDVFEEEPLPKSSPLWTHPKVKITPHIASLTYPKESTYQVLDCFDRLEKGLPLPQQVSREKMY